MLVEAVVSGAAGTTAAFTEVGGDTAPTAAAATAKKSTPYFRNKVAKSQIKKVFSNMNYEYPVSNALVK
jgi:hypothetical protein